jgi:hypothetical protein
MGIRSILVGSSRRQRRAASLSRARDVRRHVRERLASLRHATLREALMGWCKPLGGHAYESGWSKGDCTTAKGDYLEDNPNPTPSDGGIPGADKPKPGCFIATAAYGSPLEPEVQLLRRFKDDVLMKTRAGARFFENFYRPYERVSPAIVEIMEQDPQIRALVRWIVVTPVVSQLELLLRFPDAPLDGVPEPWRQFLGETRTGLETWARAIEFPDDFEGLTADAAAEEIEIVLRYLVRTEATRGTYLDHLAERGQIPLHGELGNLEAIARRLHAAGRSAAEVARIVGAAAAEAASGAAPAR